MSNRDERLARSEQTRTDRPDREATQNRELTDTVRLETFRQQFFNSALPDLPKIDGFHTCWLTTTNPRDSIMARERLGYSPIKAADIPGYQHVTIKGGEFEGCIGINEMVAYKLPEHLYQMYMMEAHHNQPMQEEERLKATLQVIAQEALRQRGRIELENGTDELGKTVEKPLFN